ncbi:trimeric intracellular cation channel family protein [Anaerofustis stercorihominis]|uniref:trimeric intracellular cation channel family protein n=1 Tax=Anaerofustis stercorihominis TaxID=214853 RepID=UPI00214AA92D|nr:trimeric intracellular cation channel family protein [Anaerofustis stercorihominis]MCR2033138.1 trimeric intracellular cation channel family protein [Anaerofustis stercorihominis]
MNFIFTEQFINICEIIGIIAFAISGAMVAIEKDLDVFGVVVLGVTTALGGGIIRDIILGMLPPNMFTNGTYAALAAVSALVVFIFSYYNYKFIEDHISLFNNALNVFDAIGLGVFVILGMNSAIFAGFTYNNFLLVFVGVITGIGGGMLRDIMVSDIPFVLRKRIYALACIVGGGLYLVMLKNNVNSDISVLIGIFSIIFIRLLSRKYKWSLPKVKK